MHDLVQLGLLAFRNVTCNEQLVASYPQKCIKMFFSSSTLFVIILQRLKYNLRQLINYQSRFFILLFCLFVFVYFFQFYFSVFVSLFVLCGGVRLFLVSDRNVCGERGREIRVPKKTPIYPSDHKIGLLDASIENNCLNWTYQCIPKMLIFQNNIGRSCVYFSGSWYFENSIFVTCKLFLINFINWRKLSACVACGHSHVCVCVF